METQKVDVSEIIDNASFFWKPFWITVMMICIMLTDGFDLFIPSYVAGDMVKEWGISRADVQPFMMAGLLGMAIGSIIFGWLGDIHGRKKSYFFCLLLMFVGSLGCYYADNITEMFWWRLVMGLGLGGVTPLATTLVSEWTNKRLRSIAVALIIVSIPLGGTLAGFAYRALAPDYGWRAMFAVGAIAPLVLFVVFSYLLPESPKYMAKHPRLYPKLAKSLNQLLKQDRFNGSEQFYVQESGKRSSNWLVTILNADFRLRTFLIWVAFTVNSFVLYVFTSQIPLLFDTAELSKEVSSMGLQYFSSGAVLGSIGGAVLISWYGSRYTGTALAALGGVASALMALVLMEDQVSTFQLFVLCLLAGASMNGMQAFMYAISAHSYPTEVRSSAVGMAQTISRAGAVVSPMVAAFYFSMDPMPSVSAFFLFMAAVVAITTISFFLIPSHIPRSTGPSNTA
jgi:AAHS family 4-hydroxybenzoate transporter-like MFS transporter